METSHLLNFQVNHRTLPSQLLTTSQSISEKSSCKSPLQMLPRNEGSQCSCCNWEAADSRIMLPLLWLIPPNGEGNGTPLQYSCLENPTDGGAWWAAVYGVAQSRTRLKRLSSSSSSIPPKVGAFYPAPLPTSLSLCGALWLADIKSSKFSYKKVWACSF